MKEILDYLSRLRENNNREWFQVHKEEYDRLRPLFVEKIQELIQQISQFDEDIVGLEAKNCMYRIYRDIRFSPDKTPYKNERPFRTFSARRGMDTIAPSGKFCMAMPTDSASAPAADICPSPAKYPAYTAPTAIPSGMLCSATASTSMVVRFKRLFGPSGTELSGCR